MSTRDQTPETSPADQTVEADVATSGTTRVEAEDQAQRAIAEEEQSGTPARKRGFSRRQLFGYLGLGAATAAAGAAGGAAVAANKTAETVRQERHTLTYDFYGEHQAGIVTPMQDQLHFAAFDLTENATREQMIALLKKWTSAAERMTKGEETTEAGARGVSRLAPPDDTGEALDLGASGLSITFGVGPTFFTQADGKDRLGIADKKPAELEDLPVFKFDFIDETISRGAVAIQACANDPQVAIHAIRNLTRMGFGTVQIKWAQLGFGRSSASSVSEETPRNLFGFKDGTNNIKTDETDDLDKWVWVADSDHAWLEGGSYLVVRKINMMIEAWDRTKLEEQQTVFGRSKIEGAPLSGGTEHSDIDFDITDAAGEPLVPADAHVRLAHPDFNDGVRINRRAYNYVDGANDLGQLSAGLFFTAYTSDPANFTKLQTSLADDALNEYIRHISSSVFAIPRGVREGEYLLQDLFEG
ncbi:iron uptake transporter deferrochelatase/peroxidase subunit [Pseudoclavibacter soli]|uniref:iron uptake transporter deferrochelatase/peroxidase subunit n=1 Tax=Pseudoclavibacter soli TaxID=452623 RepID=UPI000412823A|nr:iron uptake transporter deferrochelatase/peroxidase subunit [Pseudoclavibacter soli]